MTNTISNANHTWSASPYCTWDVTDPAGKDVGHIEAVFDSPEKYSPYTYYIDTYEVNVGATDDGVRYFVVAKPHNTVSLLEGLHGVGQFEIHPTARKALAAAKKFASAYTGGKQV
tara:strand:- start:259 stop:603 length:345 start_codon:yes stop_codon:yes gene_type:complete